MRLRVEGRADRGGRVVGRMILRISLGWLVGAVIFTNFTKSLDGFSFSGGLVDFANACDLEGLERRRV